MISSHKYNHRSIYLAIKHFLLLVCRFIVAAQGIQMFCNLLRVAVSMDILKYQSVHHCEGFRVKFSCRNHSGSIHLVPLTLGSNTNILFLQKNKCGGQTSTYIPLFQGWAQAQAKEIITMGLLDEIKLVYGGPNLWWQLLEAIVIQINSSLFNHNDITINRNNNDDDNNNNDDDYSNNNNACLSSCTA